MVARDAWLYHAGTGLIVTRQIEELGKARVRTPRRGRGGGIRGAFARLPEVPRNRITHQRPELIVCHSLTST